MSGTCSTSACNQLGYLGEWESAVSQVNGRYRVYFYIYLPFIITTFLSAEKCIEINFAKEKNKKQNRK